MKRMKTRMRKVSLNVFLCEAPWFSSSQMFRDREYTCRPFHRNGLLDGASIRDYIRKTCRIYRKYKAFRRYGYECVPLAASNR